MLGGMVMEIQIFNLLVWWIGPEPMPEWRRANVDTFVRLHPGCILHDEYVPMAIDHPEWQNRYVASDMRRRDWCKGGARRLWIDSDVEALIPFPLGDNPALAFEGFPHWSICWSGERPDIFDVSLITKLGPLFWRGAQLGKCDLISPDHFKHWATDDNGQPKERNWGKRRSKR